MSSLFYAVLAGLSVIALYALSTGIVKIIRYLHAIADKHPLTMDQELRKSMLPFGFYSINGAQRSGKTSLGFAIMDTDAEYHSEERLERAQALVDELNSIEQDDPYDLVLPEHLYYSRTAMYLTKDYIPTWHVDIDQVALPETAEDPHFAPYSFFHLEEYDSYMNARTWKNDQRKKANIIDGIKWVGHHMLTILTDSQVNERLDKAVRALMMNIFYIIDKRDYYAEDQPRKWWQFARNKEGVIKTEWTFLWIQNQMHQQAEGLSKFGDFIKPDRYIKKCKFVYEGNIYERYNPNSGQKYWLKNLREFYTAPHPDSSLSRAAVDDYCDRNSRRAEDATQETENNK